MVEIKMNNLSKYIAEWREKKGFLTPSKLSENHDVLAKLMLVVSELGEAAEAVRHQDQENFEEEIADTIIRLLDLTGTMGIDIEDALRKKMAINEGREYMHGKYS